MTRQAGSSVTRQTNSLWDITSQTDKKHKDYLNKKKKARQTKTKATALSTKNTGYCKARQGNSNKNKPRKTRGIT